jgi:hypothetical protein
VKETQQFRMEAQLAKQIKDITQHILAVCSEDLATLFSHYNFIASINILFVDAFIFLLNATN